MAVIRVEKNKNYTTMSNYHLRDKELSLKAKGLLSVMLSLPDTWDYSIAGLASICKEGMESIKNTLKELKDHYYLVVTKCLPSKENDGKISYIYTVYECPESRGQNQPLDNQPIDVQPLDNQPLENTLYNKYRELNTDISNTEILKTEEEIKESKPKKSKAFVKPTLEEIQDYINEQNYNVDAEYFFDHYEANGWYVGSKKMSDWKATLRNWNRRDMNRPAPYAPQNTTANPFDF